MWFFSCRSGDQLIEINDQKLEGLAVERVYEILDKTPPGKVYIKVLQGDTSEKLPLQLNDALSKLQSERQILDKKMANKPKGTGMASRLSFSSGDSGGELGFFYYWSQFLLYQVKEVKEYEILLIKLLLENRLYSVLG